MKSGICFSAAVSAILWLGVETPLACGGDPCESGNYLFNADVLHDSSAAAFFRDRCQSLFSCSDRWWDNLGMFTVHNVQEWMAFLANGLPDTLVSAILYNSSIPQIDSALLILKGTIPISAAPPLFADLLHDSQPGRIREFLYYLGFARRCEPWVASVPDWQAGPPDSAAVDSATGKLVEGALRQIKNVKNAFVKERYHFQIIRLHFAAKRYAACAAHFREHAAAFTVSPSMKYRSMSYVAGSYHRLRQFTEANCWYARVYRAYPALPLSTTVTLLGLRPGRAETIFCNSSTQTRKEGEEDMNGIIVREDEAFEKALRRFSKTCERAGILSDVKKYRHFEKPSEEKKRKLNASKRKRIREEKRIAWRER